MKTQEERKQVATTILDQIGGHRRLSIMIGAHTFLITDHGLSFKFKASRTANYCTIDLDPMDTYTMTIGKVRGGKNPSYKEVSKSTDLYYDQLIPVFERATGLYLSL